MPFVARKIELTGFSCSSRRFVGLKSFHLPSALPSPGKLMWPTHLQYRPRKIEGPVQTTAGAPVTPRVAVIRTRGEKPLPMAASRGRRCT
jgi:hypothetical protein